MNERLKTKAEAAAIIGISVHTLTKKVTGRVVPFTQPAGTRLVKFSDADIAEIIAMGRVKPDPNHVAATRTPSKAA